MRIVVIGAGIVGAACARRLTLDGHDVTVLDRAGTASGTSAAGEGNLLVSDKGPGAELVLAQYAARVWRRLAVELQDELDGNTPPIEFEPKGGIVVALTDVGAQALRAFAAGQREAGVDARELTPDEARDREPWLNPAARVAVHYPEDAQVQPVGATEALLASARRRGARLLQGTEVREAALDDGGALVGVRTTRGDLAADRVVLAAGPWSAEVAGRLGIHLPVLPRRGMVLVTSRMPHRVFHKVYDGDYVGAVASDAADLQTSSVVESTAAGTVLIGSSRQRIGFDERLQTRVLQEMAAKALRIFPFLAAQPVMRAYGGFRPYMPDHLPVIGADHRLPGLWHAVGHEGAGIGLSVATAELIADQLAGRRSRIDVAPYALTRASLQPHLTEQVA
ncbi:NAD(P)/FAD-dependent oxidoreductase [Flexivirga meconopsidis]|uniref:NAD(P)/FAD-dependent oxidoreductase n=1 Tax=Flexivirga meconopsidis TaxID=2977121 RepID=UPI00223FB6AA|nr:FAD-binding oxidoreductase [Flexivirga meconopsidis]